MGLVYRIKIARYYYHEALSTDKAIAIKCKWKKGRDMFFLPKSNITVKVMSKFVILKVPGWLYDKHRDIFNHNYLQAKIKMYDKD